MEVFGASKLSMHMYERVFVLNEYQWKMEILFVMLLVSKFYELTVISKISNKWNGFFPLGYFRFVVKKIIINKWISHPIRPDMQLSKVAWYTNITKKWKRSMEMSRDDMRLWYSIVDGSFVYMLLPASKATQINKITGLQWWCQ